MACPSATNFKWNTNYLGYYHFYVWEINLKMWKKMDEAGAIAQRQCSQWLYLYLPPRQGLHHRRQNKTDQFSLYINVQVTLTRMNSSRSRNPSSSMSLNSQIRPSTSTGNLEFISTCHRHINRLIDRSISIKQSINHLITDHNLQFYFH